MLDTFVARILELAEVFLTSRGFHGLIGLVIFVLYLIAFLQVPPAYRRAHATWFVELLLAPAFVFLLGSVAVILVSLTGAYAGNWFLSPVFTVPLLLLTAHLFNRASRLFIWDGVLARKSKVVPRILRNVLDVVVYTAAIYAILSFVYEQPMTGFVVSSGVVVGVLGLALQPILGDVIAGISLTIERPFAAGDWIELEDGVMGEVISLDWRATEIRTWNNTIHVVPNGKIAGASIHNYDRPGDCYGFWFYLSVDRSIAPELVRRLLLEAALKSDYILDEPSPVVRVWDADRHPIQYMVFVHCLNYRQNFAAKSELLQNAWGLFTKSGFNFSASAQDIEMRRGRTHEATELEDAVLLKEVSLLEPLTDEERSQLAADGVHHRFKVGDRIISEGDNGSSMYIMLSGMVRIHRKLSDGRKLELARLGTYDYFGEMSLLTGESRSASVTAHTDCSVLEVSKDSFKPLMDKRPELAEEIGRIMAERRLKSELIASEERNVSVAQQLKQYTEAFANSIRAFFKK